MMDDKAPIFWDGDLLKGEGLRVEQHSLTWCKCGHGHLVHNATWYANEVVLY